MKDFEEELKDFIEYTDTSHLTKIKNLIDKEIEDREYRNNELYQSLVNIILKDIDILIAKGFGNRFSVYDDDTWEELKMEIRDTAENNYSNN